MAHIKFEELQQLAYSVGLSVVAVAGVDALAEDGERLAHWQEAGYSGEMAFMQRDPGLLSAPHRLMPEAHSLVVVGAFYDRGQRAPLPLGFGRVARYAWGRDYHKVLRKRLRALCELVEKHVSESICWRVFADSIPLLERAVAKQAGVGFIGKNTMLIVPRAGSFLFLGEVLWDVEVDAMSELAPATKSHCGSCQQCLDTCPTSAFVQERVLDARRCISYLTIEKRGRLSLQEREWLGEWVFGCDICQDVCPFNVISLTRRSKPDLEEFGSERGVGQSLGLIRLLEIRTEEDFVSSFGGTPLMRAKRSGLLRNAAVVAANTGFVESLPALEASVREDPCPIVRSHALWAHSVLSKKSGERALRVTKNLLLHCRKDNHAEVQAEVCLLAESLD